MILMRERSGRRMARNLRDEVEATSGELLQAHQQLVKESAQREQTQAQLARSEAKYRALVENASEGIVVLGQGSIRFINPSGCRMIGYNEQELAQIPFMELIHVDDREMVAKRHQARLQGETVPPYDFRALTKSGREIWVEIDGTTIDWEGVPSVLLFFTDITKRRRAEQETQKALAEKESLFNELTHRMKNNMQVMASLLELQAANSSDPTVKAALTMGGTRLQAMGLVHTLLHTAQEPNTIVLSDYLRTLTKSIFGALGAKDRDIELQLHLESVGLNVDQTITCGLVINELLTNALKHAFPRGGPGLIKLYCGKLSDSRIEIQVCDNGVGMPLDMDGQCTEGRMGLHLVQGMVEKQLDGKMQIECHDGTQITIRFTPES